MSKINALGKTGTEMRRNVEKEN